MPAAAKRKSPPTWSCEMWDITRPIPYGNNPRTIPEAAIDKVAASLKAFGFRQPIVVDKAGVVVVGHTRLLAAKRLRIKQVPVHVAKDLTDVQARAYRVADNRVSDETSFSPDTLAFELADLKDLDFDLTPLGFSPDELQTYLGGEPADEAPSPDGGPSGEMRTIKLTIEQFETLMSAIHKLRTSEGATEKSMSDGRATELIVADWMAGN